MRLALPRTFTALVVTALALATAPAARPQPSIPGLTPPKADSPAAPPTAPEIAPADAIEAERLNIVAELDAAKAAAAEITPDPAALPAGSFRAEQIQLLTRLESTLAQTITVIRRRDELDVARTALESGELQSLRTEGASAVSVPDELRRGTHISFLFLEQLRNDLATHDQAAITAGDAVTAARAAVTAAQKSLESAESARRAAREAAEVNRDDARTADLTAARDLAVLRARLETATLQLRRVELQATEADARLAESRKAVAALRIDAVLPEVRFTREDLESRELDLQERQAQLDELRRLAERAITPAEFNLEDATRRRNDAPGDPIARARFDAATAALDTVKRRIRSISDQRDRTDVRTAIWQRRYEVWRGRTSDATLRAWLAETRTMLEGFESSRRLLIGDITRDRQQTATLQDQLQTIPADQAELRVILQATKQSLDDRVQALADELTQIELARRTAERLAHELDERTRVLSVGVVLERTLEVAGRVWNHEFFKVGEGDDESGITVSKITIGIGLLVFGLLFARHFARLLGRSVFPRLGVNDSATAALQTILHYVLVITVVLGALSVVRVPLTAFAFLGGAIAIGIGFGSQQIANNFISGLILLAERPIRVGDFIEVGSFTGTVSRIGGRSTIIRTGTNTELIVPNSRFLENDVVNWTLSDREISASVEVGVSYGSSLRDVVALLKKAAEDHGRVLGNPAPGVILKDFGESAVIFSLSFNFKMQRPGDRVQIASDIRMRIDSLFSEAGIVIAYPRRDINISPSTPIPIRVVPAEAAATQAVTPGPPAPPA